MNEHELPQLPADTSYDDTLSERNGLLAKIPLSGDPHKFNYSHPQVTMLGFMEIWTSQSEDPSKFDLSILPPPRMCGAGTAYFLRSKEGAWVDVAEVEDISVSFKGIDPGNYQVTLVRSGEMPDGLAAATTEDAKQVKEKYAMLLRRPSETVTIVSSDGIVDMPLEEFFVQENE